MPDINWNKFDSLPGSKSWNFESLCRALICLHFRSYGQFVALKNQPGVEFHLKLSKNCPALGAPLRWYGWQCKFHERTNAGNLRANSRKNIEKSLRKTEKHLSGITDWVLWTPYILSNKDQQWFRQLHTNFELHLWSEKEVEQYLNGPGLMYRQTYFGDLVATPEELKKIHREAIQPILERWLDPVHQSTEAERNIRRMLGEPGSWKHLFEIGERISNTADKISEFSTNTLKFPVEIVNRFIKVSRIFADTLLNFHATLAERDLEIIKQQLRDRYTILDGGVRCVPRKLRKLNVPISLDATNILEDMFSAQKILDEVEEFLGTGIVALLADAGRGKTHFSAAITSPKLNRPAGILLYGRNLQRRQNLDDLARNFSLSGEPLVSMEKLLALLDAAAKRSKCRLPLVIDGLNEAENPKDWKDLLASLSKTINLYPNVLVICTLRTGEQSRVIERHRLQSADRESFAVMSLPKNIKQITSEGFGSDVEEACEKYFKHFNIDPGNAYIPIEFLQHPLNLRIFCEVTNFTRKSPVRVDYFPASLTLIFEKFMNNIVDRISELPNLSPSYLPYDIESYIHKMGIMFWEGKRQEIKEQDFSDAVSDKDRSWESKIVNLFVQEGLIMRNPGDTPYECVITPMYNALGGYIIANSLLTEYTSDNSFQWLHDRNVINSFKGNNSHELASDIFEHLVTLTPYRMNRKQLWKVAPTSLRDAAIAYTILLDAKFLDQETITELKKIFSKNPQFRNRLYARLHATHAAENHLLNADFLDAILRPLSVAERDLSWTEWVRETRDKKFSYLITVEKRWKSLSFKRLEDDILRAKWLMWYLTSTDRDLRDVTTRALYWFGRGDPATLFKLTLSSLDISDPYVPERMFAASYGVVMALYGGLDNTLLSSDILTDFARKIFVSMFADGAPHRTTHHLLREYAFRTIAITSLHHPSLFSPEELAKTKPPFTVDGLPLWGEGRNNKGTSERVSSPFNMDFENYTLGKLVPDRSNYDYKHVGYKKIKAQILWRIEQLGWSGDKFEIIDNMIAGRQRRSRSDYNPGKTDRYGKKYSWIAYFEMSGLLHDQGGLDRINGEGRTADVDIDPSFPERIAKMRLIDTDILGNPTMEMDDWLAEGEQPDVAPYLRISKVGAHEGPWIMLDGYVIQEDEVRERQSFYFVRSFIVKNTISDQFQKHLLEWDVNKYFLPDKSSVYYTFSGEIPWCETYLLQGKSKFTFEVADPRAGSKKLAGDTATLTSSENTILRTGKIKLSETDTEEVDPQNLLNGIDDAQKEYEKLEAFIPVCDFKWESYHTVVNDAGHAVVLAKEIAIDLDLINHAQEFDLFTRDGTRASLCVSDRGDSCNCQSLFFMRENLLQSYLRKNDSTLLWLIWGERGYSSKQIEARFHGPNHPERTHGKIRIILPYE